MISILVKKTNTGSLIKGKRFQYSCMCKVIHKNSDENQRNVSSHCWRSPFTGYFYSTGAFLILNYAKNVKDDMIMSGEK